MLEYETGLRRGWPLLLSRLTANTVIYWVPTEHPGNFFDGAGVSAEEVRVACSKDLVWRL